MMRSTNPSVKRTVPVRSPGAMATPQVSMHEKVQLAPEEMLVKQETINSFLSGLRSQTHEMDYRVPSASIVGQIPSDLPSGTLFRNGPALMERGGKTIDQPFDGDGMISRFTLDKGKVHFSNRFVRTKGFVDEQKAGRFLYKSVFSRNVTDARIHNPFNLAFKNVANTAVLEWASKLFAFHESGRPHALRPDSLETVGMTDFFGRTAGKGDVPVGAHYKIRKEGDRRSLINFCAQVKGMDAVLRIFELDEQGRTLRQQERLLKNAAFGFFHDFVVTDNYYVFFENPTRMDFKKFLTEYFTGKCSMAETLTYHRELPVNIHVVPRFDAAAPMRTFRAPSCFTFHFVNGFEEGDKGLVIDAVAWADMSFTLMCMGAITPDYYIGGQRPELTRFSLDLHSGLVGVTKLSERVCEFPCVNPGVVGKRHRFAFVAASAVDHPVHWGPNHCIVKYDFAGVRPDAKPSAANPSGRPSVDLWYAGPHRFPQEPIFVPKAGATGKREDAGYLLTLVYDGETETTDLVILDGENISGGPVATVKLDHHIPFGLHGSWSPNVHVDL